MAGCGDWRVWIHDPVQTGWRQVGYVSGFPEEDRIGVATGLLLGMTRRNVYGLVGFQHVVTNEFHMTFLDTSMEPPSIRWLT